MSLKRTIDKVSNVIDTDTKAEKLTEKETLARLKDGNINIIKPLHVFANEAEKIELEKDGVKIKEHLKDEMFRCDYSESIDTNYMFFFYINLSRLRDVDEEGEAEFVVICSRIQKKKVYDTLVKVIQRGFDKLLSKDSSIKIDYQLCTDTEAEGIRELFGGDTEPFIEDVYLYPHTMNLSLSLLKRIMKGERDGALEKILKAKKVDLDEFVDLFCLRDDESEAITSCEEDPDKIF